MARGQLTFIILTLMDYLIPYIPGPTPHRPPPPTASTRHPSQPSPKYGIIFMDVFKLMHQGVPAKESPREEYRESKGDGANESPGKPVCIVFQYTHSKLTPESRQASPLRWTEFFRREHSPSLMRIFVSLFRFIARLLARFCFFSFRLAAEDFANYLSALYGSRSFCRIFVCSSVVLELEVRSCDCSIFGYMLQSVEIFLGHSWGLMC